MVGSTKPVHEVESESRFATLQAAFESARRRAACRETGYRLCGAAVRLRIVGESLARHIEAPLAHLRMPGGATEPALRIDLWDAGEAGVPGPPSSETHAAGKTWVLGSGAFAASPDGRFASHELGRAVIWLDRRRRQITGWFADATSLSLHQRGKPLQLLLALWANDRGLLAVHAGLVARRGRGVLVPGRSGSGKSTLTLSCLLGGHTYLGDDWIGIERAPGGTFHGHGLYGSASLDSTHAARFTPLQPYASSSDASEKSLFLLHRHFPGALGDSADICALALPRIVEGARARLHPASKSEALLALAPGTVFAMRPRAGRAAVERLAELAVNVPAWWLDIGCDLSEIPRRVDEIIAARGAPPS